MYRLRLTRCVGFLSALAIFALYGCNDSSDQAIVLTDMATEAADQEVGEPVLDANAELDLAVVDAVLTRKLRPT